MSQSPNKIRFIHLGDIHIQDSRREEFANVFKLTYESIRQDIAPYPTFIALCGDVYDSKTKASATNMADVHNFLLNLQNIAPVIMIPGNHDLNMNRPGSLDLLTPITSVSGTLNNLTYWRKSGIYTLPNYPDITFVVTAPDDKIQRLEVRPQNKFVIGMMHEEVYGAFSFGYNAAGIRFDGTKITKDLFVNMDLVMLGHIHERQKITDRAGYCGSLIQRNFGEYHYNHGYCIWDCEANMANSLSITYNSSTACTPLTDLSSPPQYQVRNILNNNGYITYRFKNDKNITVQPIPRYPNSIIIEYESCNPQYIIDQIAIIRKESGDIKNVRCVDKMYDNIGTQQPANFNDLGDNQNNNLANNQINQNNDSANSNNDLADNQINQNNDSANPTMLIQPDNVIELGEELASFEIQEELIRQMLHNNPYADRVINLHQITASNIENNVSRKIRWKLKKLLFANMYCFGPGNCIDFTKFDNSLSGIIAPNRYGKSSVVDILLYVLFDEITRAKKTDILTHNYNTNSCEATVEFEVEGKIGTISRRITSRRNETTTKLVFDGVDLTEGTVSETYKKIENLIGNYKDNISTVVCLQRTADEFIDLTEGGRKLLLAKLFHLNIFDVISANNKTIIADMTKDFNNKNKIYQGLACVNNKQKLDNFKQDVLYIQKNIENNIIYIEDINNKIKQLDFYTKFKIPQINEYSGDEITKEELLELNSFDNYNPCSTVTTDNVLYYQYYEIIRKYSSKPIKPANPRMNLPIQQSINLSNQQNQQSINQQNSQLNLQSINLSNTLQQTFDINLFNKLLELKVEPIWHQLNSAELQRLHNSAELYIDTVELESKIDKNIINNPRINSTLFAKCAAIIRKYLTSQTKISDPDLPPDIANMINEHQKLSAVITELNTKFNVAMAIKNLININDLADNCPKCCHIKNIANIGDISARLKQNGEQCKIIETNLVNYCNILDKYVKDDTAIQDAINSIANIAVIKKLQQHRLYELMAIYINNQWDIYEQYETAEKIIKEAENSNYLEKERIAKRQNELLMKLAGTKFLYLKQIAIFNQKNTQDQYKLGELNAKIHNMEVVLEELKNQDDELKKINDELQLYITYNGILDDKKGIPMLLLARNIKTFTNSVNQVLVYCTDMQIEMNNVDFSMYIKNGTASQKEPIDLGSGYQKFIISLACRIALANISNTPLLDGIIIDEGFTYLDANNIENALEFLHKLSRYHKLLFIITHLDAMQNSIDRPMAITRKKVNIERTIDDNKIMELCEYSYINNCDDTYELPDVKPAKSVVAHMSDFTDEEDRSKTKCNYCNVIIQSIKKYQHTQTIKHMRNKGLI